jgi:hypothetical protein
MKPANRSNGSTDEFSPIWLDWSNATIAVNLMRMDEVMRCRSPIDLMAVGSRFALRSWFHVWLPLLQGQYAERPKRFCVLHGMSQKQMESDLPNDAA